jgi:hypothetical protein
MRPEQGAQFVVVDVVFPHTQGTRQRPPAPSLREAIGATRAEVGSPAWKLIANVKRNLSASIDDEPDQFGPGPDAPAAGAGARRDVAGHR